MNSGVGEQGEAGTGFCGTGLFLSPEELQSP